MVLRPTDKTRISGFLCVLEGKGYAGKESNWLQQRGLEVLKVREWRRRCGEKLKKVRKKKKFKKF